MISNQLITLLIEKKKQQKRPV